MLKLCFVHNPGSGIWLVEPGVRLGRSAQCDLVLPQAEVDEVQAEIKVELEELQYTPLSDAVASRVNGRRLNQGVSVSLKVGDRLQIGSSELEVIDPKRQTAAPQVTESAVSADLGWGLRARHKALANRFYPITATTLVGRSSECDIVLAAAHLSRRHAQLSIRDGALYAKDLSSLNGTYVNGTRIDEKRLQSGDELRFDSLGFSVVGPTDELDKTSVRPALKVAQAASAAAPLRARGAARSNASSPSSVAPSGASMAGSERKPGPHAAAAVTVSIPPARPSRLRQLLLVGGLLALAGAGLWLVWERYWLP